MTAVKDVLKVEVNTAVTTNKLKNPSAKYALWGWTKAGGGTSSVNGFVLTNVSSTLTTDKVPVTAGQWVGLTGYGKAAAVATKGFTCKIRYYNVSNVIIGSAVQIAGPIVPAAGATFAATSSSQAPVGAVTMTLELDTAGASSGAVYIKDLMLTTAATSGAANQPITPDVWVDILGTGLNVRAESGNKLKGVEDVLTPGVLTAVITDPALDPNTSTSLRKGRPIRVQATASGTKGVWQGLIEEADVDYDDNKSGTPRRRITITAIDVARALDNTPLSTTVTGAFAGQVAAAAFAARLPTSDGTTTPEAGTGVEASEDNSTATDWIRRACNTHTGVVWIDQFGEIQQRLVSGLATTAAYTFSDDPADTGAMFYTGLGLNFGSKSLVNALNIKRMNVDEVEDGYKLYGPYVALDSELANGGRVTEEIEITAGSPSALAAAVLPVWATPKIFPTEIRVNAMHDLAQVLSVKKYDPVRVKRSTLFDGVVRVLSIRHEITPENWYTYFTVRPLETTTAVIVTNPSAGADTGPGDIDTGEGTGFPRIGSVVRTGSSASFNFTTSGTTYKIPFAAADVEYADGIAWDDSTDEFVITRAGRYMLSGSIAFANNATGFRTVSVAINGTPRLSAQGNPGANTSAYGAARPFKLAVGDRVSLEGAQTSGGSLAINSLARWTYLVVAYIGP